MGSVGNQNSWPSYYSYKDCSIGICSIYCPQFCYFIFPPPPPSDGDSSSPFSPLIIAIIGILASAFLLVSYYTIVTRYYRRDQRAGGETEENRDEILQDQWQVAPTGLDEAIIKTITVCKYRKDEGLIEGTECAVCLSEFQELESLRLLPKCSHAFHLPCIDTWLKSHSNCPLCRANVTASAQPLPNTQTSSLHSYEVQGPNNDLILVVDDQEMDCRDQVVLSLAAAAADDDDTILKSSIRDVGNAVDTETSNENVQSGEESVKQFRRSRSLGAFPFPHQLLISDVLRIKEIDDVVGSSVGNGAEEFKFCPSATKRCNSTGRLMFIDDNKGKNSLIPH